MNDAPIIFLEHLFYIRVENKQSDILVYYQIIAWSIIKTPIQKRPWLPQGTHFIPNILHFTVQKYKRSEYKEAFVFTGLL